MKKSIWIFTLTTVWSIMFLTYSCKDNNSDINNGNGGNTKNKNLPVLKTIDKQNITTDFASIDGEIISDGGLDITEIGICWNTNSLPTIGNFKNTYLQSSSGNTFSTYMNNLIQNTTYFVRAFATNEAGTGYGNEIIIKTKTALLPTVTLGYINWLYNISISSAQLEISVTSDGGSIVTESGVCYSTHIGPTLSDSVYRKCKITGVSYPIITGLIPNTKYYIRAYATNGVGTSYSKEDSLTTREGIIGNTGTEYHIVTIGTQTWMEENLRETSYQNGENITFVLRSSNSWKILTTSEMCWYQGLDEYQQVKYIESYPYGYLYNFFAATDSRNIAPKGWHVATYNDWSTLINYLGGRSVAGKKLKERGTSHWYYESGATNESGFRAVGAGYRNLNGIFTSFLHEARWWSSTDNGTDGYHFIVGDNGSEVSISSYASNSCGMSIRCVKN